MYVPAPRGRAGWWPRGQRGPAGVRSARRRRPVRPRRRRAERSSWSPRRGRAVVTLLGARGNARPIDPDDHAAPRAIALGVAGAVADGVLARQLLGDLLVNGGELRHRVRKECSPAGLLGELPKDELRLPEPAR